MPWGDRTGPVGAGPRTGRGLGYCGGFNAPGYMNPGAGRGFGRGRGWRCFGGFGRRFRFRWFWRAPFFGGAYFEDEAELLRQEAEILRKNLEAVEKRLSEIEKEK